MVLVSVLAKVPLALVSGAMKLTGTPLTGFPKLSTTYIVNGNGNGIKLPVCWSDPSATPNDEALPEAVYS